MFFFLNFLAATQDIAVDGWALTMLQRHNVGYASTCNSVGQVWIYIKLIECYRVVLMWRHKWFRLYDPFTPHILCPKNFN